MTITGIYNKIYKLTIIENSLREDIYTLTYLCQTVGMVVCDYYMLLGETRRNEIYCDDENPD